MVIRRVVTILMLSVVIAAVVPGGNGKSLWDLKDYFKDEPAKEEHTVEKYEEVEVDPAIKLYGPAAVAHRQEFDRLYQTFLSEGEDDVVYGHCYLHPEKDYDGDQVTGKILFRQQGALGKVHMKLELHGLKTEHHDHGLHIDEFGDMADGCHNVGDVYNPFHEVHGGPKSVHHRVGDLGNVHEDANGDAYLEGDLQLATLIGPYRVIGRSCTLTQHADDLGEGQGDDSGGKPIACCTIAIDDGHDWHN